MEYAAGLLAENRSEFSLKLGRIELFADAGSGNSVMVHDRKVAKMGETYDQLGAQDRIHMPDITRANPTALEAPNWVSNIK